MNTFGRAVYIFIYIYTHINNIRGLLGVKGINRKDPAFIFNFSLFSINFHFQFNIPGRARVLIEF